MGIVVKQSFWASAFAYLGVGIGYITTLYLRPKYLDLEQIGLLNLVISNALLIAPFTAMGMPGTLVRFFPHFEGDEQLKRRFLSFQFTIILIANIFFGLLVYVNLDWIKSYFEAESSLYNQYILVSFIVLISHSFFLQLQAYSSITMDIIVPSALKDVFLRLGNAIIILAFGFDIINFDWAVYALGLIYSFALLIQCYYIVTQKGFRISTKSIKIPGKWHKEVWTYGSFTMAFAAGSSIYTNISYLLVSGMIGLEANGIFTICLYIGIIIELPKRAVLQITGPIISKAFKEGKMEQMNALYQRSSLTLGVVGLLFLLGIVCNINDLFLLIPKGNQISEGTYVVIAVASAKLIDMLFGLNGSILVYSQHYKFNVYFLTISATLLYFLDIWLIPIYGINGAAIAFFASTIVLNLLKHFYIVRRVKLTPFTFDHIKLLLIGIILLVCFYFISIFGSPLFDIIVRSVLITIIYIVIIYNLKISEDINSLIKSNLKKHLNINIR